MLDVSWRWARGWVSTLSRRSVIAILCGLAAPACGSTATPRERFEAEVVPLLERYCAAAACHGVAPDAEARGERVDWTQLLFRIDGAGRLTDLDAAYAAARRAINTQEPAFSSLLRKPLGAARGGLPHLGGAVFFGDDDPAYVRLRAWIEEEAGGGEDPAPLTPLEQQFADTVQALLAAGTCMTSRCHGPTAGATPYRLDVGVGGAFSVAATRHNHLQTLALVTLDGYPLQSRLIRKAQSLGPGIVHKAPSWAAFAGPAGRVPTITDWICAERLARTGAGCAASTAAPISAFVFVRGPVAARAAFDLDDFTPGSDLWLATVGDRGLAPVALEDLTAALHPGRAVDIRDPAVSRDGRRVVFAMRTAVDQGHHLWVLDLATRAARQLTAGNGPLPGGGMATDRDPTWGPDETIWFASTRAGVVADQGRLLDAELYSLVLDTGAVRRWTFTPHVERKPGFLDLGEEAGGEVAFTALRDASPSTARAHTCRFPPSMRTEYHPHFGLSPAATYFDDLRELPDGRYVSVVGDLPAVWSSGGLAVIDRSLGPALDDRGGAAEPALERYAPSVVRLPGDGAYRDPAPLPDGRILVAHQRSPFDPADPTAVFAPRIEVLELRERADGAGPTVAGVEVLLEEPGVALTDPEPVSVRGPVRVDGVTLPPAAGTTAVFRHQGLPMTDALLANLSPSGVKRPRTDLRAVRLIEHLPLTPAQRRIVPPEDTWFGVAGATSVALGSRGPARVLAELPLEADGSFQALVPVGVPFRIQALDAAGVAVGAAHDRWFYALPGQVLTQGVSAAIGTARYGAMCAGCHGDPEGVAGRAPAMEEPDTLTGASLSLARFARQDPRRPIEPAELGWQTRLAIDFRRDVQPILDRHCVACHTGKAAAAGVDLSATPTRHFTRAYEHLLRPGTGSGGGRAYVDDVDGRADRSYLIELLTGVERAAPRALRSPGIAHPDAGASVTDEERLVLVRWIDLGATFVGVVPDGAP